MVAKPSETTLLVTGASGFIALHCIHQLLERGYRVRGTLRTPSRESRVREAIGKHVEVGDRLEIFAADLTSDDGWAEAVRGCTYVLHVASPFPPELPKHEDELIVPARDGALRVLRAAADAGVRRVVMTSSLAAVCYGHERNGSRIFNEDDWSVVDRIAPYEKSKTIAERAAWDFVERRPLELATICPGAVLGPILDADYSTSGEVVRKLMKRELPGCPPLGWAAVDVRDVAAAHIAAMTVPEAAGQRFCCAIEHAWISDIAEILARNFSSRGYKVPTRKLPGFVMRIAALYDKTARVAVHNINQRSDISNERIKKVLDWKPRSLEEMVVSMGESMIEHGVV